MGDGRAARSISWGWTIALCGVVLLLSLVAAAFATRQSAFGIGSDGFAARSTTVSVSAPLPTVTLSTNRTRVLSGGTGSCLATSGALALKASAARLSGVSPLLVFFDATGTTDSSLSGNTTAFQDVAYTWNFGDTGASGTGTWAYGSNAGHNSKNTATGGVAAHLYITPGADTAYTVTVTAHDGSNTASCQLGVTAYDPAGANGFPGTATTCVAANSTPVAGSGGCPAGAAVVQQSNFGTALTSALGNGKRVLFECGNTFSGSYETKNSQKKMTIGAYGGCENTTRNRPIFNLTGNNYGIGFNSSNTVVGPSDVRIIDIDFEGNGGSGLSPTHGNAGYNNSQITIYNTLANELQGAWTIQGGSQLGLIANVATGASTQIATFWPYAGFNCLNGNNTFQCGQGSSAVYANSAYVAAIGNSFNGKGLNPSQTLETYRMSGCQQCVFENNAFLNGSTGGGSMLKMHGANTHVSQQTWIGEYTQYLEISDNSFSGTGFSGLELSPQNALYDERIRYVVVERNVFNGLTSGQAGLISAQNVSLRDNVINSTGTNTATGFRILTRGTPATGCSSCSAFPAQYIEVYNNTCEGPNCLMASNTGGYYGAGPNYVTIQNTLCYQTSSGCITISNASCNGNCIGLSTSNNTANDTLNPGWTNGSGTFNLTSDWKPTANYSGGTSVPVLYDALGGQWSPTWALGAVHP